MATASIVRLGPTDGNLSSGLLREALASYFNSKGNNNDTTDDDSRIVVENKYFSAKIILENIEKQNRNGNDGDPSDGTKEDGVILVFDGLKSNPDRSLDGLSGGDGTTFDELAIVQERADNTGNFGDLLRLCVGVTLSPDLQPQDWRGTDHEKEYSRRILWCLDHGYEYVEADLSESGQRRGHNERDKEGFARIVEAIEGTVWSSAVMGRTQTKQLKDSYGDDKAALEPEKKENEDKITNESSMLNGGDDEVDNAYIPPNPSQLLSHIGGDDDQDDNEATERTKDLLNGQPLAEPDQDVVMDPTKVGSNEMAKLREDMEIEKQFDQMDSVIQEAKRIREASQNGTMSDDERRERAGDAATALLNLMGQLGMDEGDDDDESEGEASSDLDS